MLRDGAERASKNPFKGDADLITENKQMSEELACLRLRVLELEQQANSDPLVPVYNRRAFMIEIGRAQSVLDRYEIRSSVMFFDLNDFKAVNDQFGHAIGDELLRKIGECLNEGVRSCDMVARLGGDEFGILLFNAAPDIARAKAAALTCRIQEQQIFMPTGTIAISAAWGVAPVDVSGTPEQILSLADRAMYQDKKLNRPVRQ